jgi:hypothetical protein
MNRAGPRHPTAADPDLIRADIARTRQELGVTVEALLARADVKARARERVGDARRRAADLAGPAGRAALVVAIGIGVLMLVQRLRDRRWR